MFCEMRIEPYGDRYFALYDGDELVCVTVYKKGAREVKRRIEELREGVDHGKVSEAAGVYDVEQRGGPLQCPVQGAVQEGGYEGDEGARRAS